MVTVRGVSSQAVTVPMGKPKLTISVTAPAYVHMPVWVAHNVPVPYRDPILHPFGLSGGKFEVRRNGVMLKPLEMPAGACVVFLGTLLHRGGANRSAAPRLAFSNQYCEPWARTQENFYLGVPPERVARMSARLQVLLGYEVMPPFMGHVTASHPSKVLQPGYVNALIAGKARTGTG